jgi:hypothetical protein
MEQDAEEIKNAKAELIDKVQGNKLQLRLSKEIILKVWASFYCSREESNFDSVK